MSELPAVFLALGSNLGDRRRNLAVALLRLEPLLRVEAVSSLYETEPVGPDQPKYLNAVCRGITGLAPRALLRHVQEVEREIGRRPDGTRWGPRPIDIDLLLYGDVVADEPELRLPHPELAERAFVLVPLAELAGEARHPLLGESIVALAAKIDASGVRKQADAGWERQWPRAPAASSS